jgi:hypothetical protein
MRDAEGKLLPGHGMKSPGRPRGKTEAEKIRELLSPHKPKILAKLIELAAAGDPVSMRLYFERVSPPLKQDAEKVNLPGFRDAPTLQGKAEIVLAAAAGGVISAEAAEKLLRVLQIYQATCVATDHEVRLRALEDGKASRVIEPEADESEVT